MPSVSKHVYLMLNPSYVMPSVSTHVYLMLNSSYVMPSVSTHVYLMLNTSYVMPSVSKHMYVMLNSSFVMPSVLKHVSWVFFQLSYFGLDTFMFDTFYCTKSGVKHHNPQSPRPFHTLFGLSRT